MKISPETWKRVDPLVTEALALDQGVRTPWLVALRSRDAELAPVVEALLATHERLERTGSKTVPGLAPVGPGTSGFSSGDPVGPFRLVRMLGRGGMGEVWLAERADGTLTRQVALKLPTTIEARSVRDERFARERDILARLEHPHIARLYDAGATAEEQPWLAMEYVAGERLDTWSQRQVPSTRERIALFRQVLAAVALAHRHLVVHRDIKPANILVDAAGQVKLLDFGIAKLVGAASEDSQDLTRLGGRVMTLRYAAPEQVAGEAITTATDIYSLGVVLHELLVGVSPYAAVREGKTLNEATLLQAEVALPSSVANAPGVPRTLSGDLDAILLKALRRDPAQRYATVEQLDDDLARYLSNQPVLARDGTWRYLAGRFARRHRAALAAAAIVVVAVGAGAMAVENERRQVVAQKERAERHLASVRSLANSLMFDVHEQVRDLPGAVEARRVLVESAGRYLERIAPEAGSDPTFRRELADAYFKLGNIQGEYGAPNLGQPKEALANYAHAVALLEPAVATVPESAELYVRVQSKRGALLDYVEESQEAIAAFATAREVARRLASAPAARPQQRIEHATLIVEHTWRLSRKGDPEVRGQGLEEGMGIVREVERGFGADTPETARIAAANARAWMASQMGHYLRRRPDAADKRRALGFFQEALAVREEAAKREPANRENRRNIVAHQTYIGLTLSELGDAEKAMGSIARAAAGMESLAGTDPGNAQFQRDLHYVRMVQGKIELLSGQPARALDTALVAGRQEAALSEVQRGTLDFRRNSMSRQLVEAGARIRLASAAPVAGRGEHLARARDLLTRAGAVLAELEKSDTRGPPQGPDRETLTRLNAELAALGR